MKKIALLVISLLAHQSSADTKIKVVTDESELRKITDSYRSNPERPKDFIPQGDGTVIDKRTGLQWMQCALGQKNISLLCQNKPNSYTLKHAQTENLNFAGYNDWRLPTLWELETLGICSSAQDYGRRADDNALYNCKGNYKKPTLAQQIFPNNWSDSYWIQPTPDLKSFTSDLSSVVIDFSKGGYNNSKVITSHVRLVRNPK